MQIHVVHKPLRLSNTNSCDAQTITFMTRKFSMMSCIIHFLKNGKEKAANKYLQSLFTEIISSDR